MNRSFAVALAALSLTSLVACGQPEQPNATAADGSVDAPSSTSASSGELVEAVRCWGLTNAATFLRTAAPDMAADLPVAEHMDYRMWHHQALRLAAAQGMTLSQFEALKDEHGMSATDLFKEEARRDAAGPLKTCLDRVPTDQTEPPQLAQG